MARLTFIGNRTTSKMHQNHVFKGPGRSGFVFGMRLGLRSRMITLILRKLLQTRLGTFLDLPWEALIRTWVGLLYMFNVSVFVSFYKFIERNRLTW
jgi:hypothetical protein